MARPSHATWYVRRVSLPPALQALTCRLGAPAHPWKECAFSSYPGRCRSGNATIVAYNPRAKPSKGRWLVHLDDGMRERIDFPEATVRIMTTVDASDEVLL